ncbi:MAG: hypothetical protein ACXWKU_22145 [Caulobacteraceae bacterium]
MTAISETPATLDIGRVIQELFSVLGRNLATFGALAVILVGLPTAILYGVLGTTITSRDPMQIFGPGMGWFMLSAWFIGLLGLILQGTIIYGAVSDLNERPVSVTDSLRVGLHAFLPLLGLGICFAVAVVCGLVLLIVPGVMMAVAWCVAVPVYVVERPGVFASFGRAAALTRGSRWTIFGLFVIYIIAAIIIQALLGIVGGVANFLTIGGLPILNFLIITPLIQVATALIGSTGVAVLYVELRRIRDGVGPQGLAAIFD